MLFATGDMELWLIMSKKDAIGKYYNNKEKPVKASSYNETPHKIKMHRRKGNF